MQDGQGVPCACNCFESAAFPSPLLFSDGDVAWAGAFCGGCGKIPEELASEAGEEFLERDAMATESALIRPWNLEYSSCLWHSSSSLRRCSSSFLLSTSSALRFSSSALLSALLASSTRLLFSSSYRRDSSKKLMRLRISLLVPRGGGVGGGGGLNSGRSASLLTLTLFSLMTDSPKGPCGIGTVA